MDGPPSLSNLRDFKPSTDGKSLRAEYLMRDFAAVLDLIRSVGEAAEAMDHHPDIHLTRYRRLALELTTHSAGKLTEKDFLLAVRIEALPKSLKG